ncbi:AraC family transcriptional regulator [Schaedlerella arabinosiphila]|nr:AraC family transcriptional regulator [Schaedlerella arabinosiphila]KAI4442210.1 HTH-type transcriptional activator RhaS [Schaedlerella arabinosiphila]
MIKEWGDLYMNDIFYVLQNQTFIDLCIYQFGYAQNDPLSSYGPHIRSHYLFHYVISGCGTLQATDENGAEHTYHIRSNQGFLIVPGQITTYTADKEHPWEYTWIEFDGMHAKEALMLSGLSINNPVYRSSEKIYSAKLKESMLYIAHHPTETPFNLLSHLYMFIDCLMHSSASRTTPSSSGMSTYYLEWAFSYIAQNFQNDITIAGIAESCKIHRNYLCKIFREHVGVSPQEFLITYRMNKAEQLLKTTSLSIKDIGNAVGYPNQLHFSRAFKNTYGVSPSQWRKAQQTGEKGSDRI